MYCRAILAHAASKKRNANSTTVELGHDPNVKALCCRGWHEAAGYVAARCDCTRRTSVTVEADSVLGSNMCRRNYHG